MDYASSSYFTLANYDAVWAFMVQLGLLLLFLLSFAGQSPTNAAIACAIFFGLWLSYTVYIFRRRIFKKRYQNAPVAVWEDET